MGLFDFITSLGRGGRIKNLEAQLRVRTTPQLYLQLADAYKESGNGQKAAQILKLGVARFPSAPEIVRRQATAEKIERENEKRRLTDKIQTHPNPILYARLAELCKADNDIDKTIQICQAGIKSFPKYGGTYLVLGQIYVEKRQWDQALGQLEKSVELDKYNYMALKLLAQVYMQVQRPSDAVRRLEDILYFAPGDEAILELLKKSREAAGPVTKALTETSAISREAAAQRSGLRKGVSSPERKTVVLGRLADQQAGAPTGQRDKVFNDGITALRGVEGVTGAILVDQFGLVVAANLDASMDEGLAGALITNVYRTASTNSVKLGVGQFEEGVVEGASGNVHLVQFDDMILAVFAVPTAKMGLLEKTIRDFAMAVHEHH